MKTPILIHVAISLIQTLVFFLLMVLGHYGGQLIGIDTKNGPGGALSIGLTIVVSILIFAVFVLVTNIILVFLKKQQSKRIALLIAILVFGLLWVKEVTNSPFEIMLIISCGVFAFALFPVFLKLLNGK